MAPLCTKLYVYHNGSMKHGKSARRLAENELFFRDMNDNVVQGFANLQQIAVEEDDTKWLPNVDQPIKFFCECSDMKCEERIELKPSRYKELHQNTDQFIVLPGHNDPDIERIIKSSKHYLVVEKFVTIPRNSDTK
jgi:hypothetical protein